MKRKGISGAASYAVVLALSFALALFVILLTLILTEDIDESYSAPFFFYFFSGAFFACLCATLSIFIHLPIHESGHLVFGLLSGYRFLSFRIGRLTLQKCPHGLRLKFFSLRGSAGQCLMAPKEPNSEKMPTFLYNIGGGAMNIAASAVALVIGIIFKERDHLLVALAAFSAVGVYMAITNLIPMRLGGIANDGYNALTLIKNPSARRALSVQLATNEATAYGKRLSSLPEEWFFEIHDEKNSIHTAAHAYLCAQRLLDLGRFDEAKERMTALLRGGSDLLPIYECLIRVDLAFLESHLTKDILRADGILTPDTKRIMKAMHLYPSVIRSEYALARLRGNTRAAERLLAKFERISKSYPNPAEIETERTLIASFDENITLTV